MVRKLIQEAINNLKKYKISSRENAKNNLELRESALYEYGRISGFEQSIKEMERLLCKVRRRERVGAKFSEKDQAYALIERFRELLVHFRKTHCCCNPNMGFVCHICSDLDHVNDFLKNRKK